ncbi:hypothetical protein SK224_16555 [Microbacterium sp. BG28]|uniref:hypothetical protein n=1 Tax=Microbacterium sp. BG28 TaxID=3097356 RepID=UPI002A5A7F40|nr:hypothetical protein [Microbacterium sp. BG28]MDY0830748.1 hypothetical protein [Microbacterium sp. BG28]
MPKNEGAVIPAWSGRRAADALAQVKAKGRTDRTPCCICGHRIDYDLPGTHPQGCTVQHLRSRRRFPELTWLPSNWAPAHKECNESDGDGTRGEDEGVTSSDW